MVKWTLLIAVMVVVSLVLPQATDQVSLGSTATSTSRCRGADATFQCMQSRMNTVTRVLGVRAAMNDLRVLYVHDPLVVSQCHQLTHTVGNAGAEMYQGDIASAFAEGDSFCWSGYYHGVVERAVGIVGRDMFISNANDLCAKIPGKERYSFDYYNCVHGLGHGLMAIMHNDVFASLPLCDRLSGGWERKSCYGGVFMENIMADYRGHGRADLKADDLMYPCSAVATTYKEQCYLMQTSYALKQNGYDFRSAFVLCATVDEDFRDTCAQSIGRDASGHSVSNVAATAATCALARDDRQEANCITGAVKDFISYFHGGTQAHELCAALPERFRDACLTTAETQLRTL